MTRSEIAKLIKVNPHSLGNINVTEAIRLNRDSADSSLVLSTLAFINENPYSTKHLCKPWQTFIEKEDPEFAALLQKKAAFEEKSPEEQAAEIASGKKNFNLTEAIKWAGENPDEYAAAVKEANEQGVNLDLVIMNRMIAHAKKSAGDGGAV